MRARVLFSNGKRTFDYLWVRHDGSDVYWGWTGSADKSSYHASGATHTVSLGVRSPQQMRSPLRELKGHFHLTTLSFNNDSMWFDLQSGRDYSGGESDALLMVDSRAIPAGAHVSVSLGLVEPGRLDLVQRVPSTPDQPLADDLVASTKQILVSTAVHPWVYAVLHWIRPRPET